MNQSPNTNNKQRRSHKLFARACDRAHLSTFLGKHTHAQFALGLKIYVHSTLRRECVGDVYDPREQKVAKMRTYHLRASGEAPVRCWIEKTLISTQTRVIFHRWLGSLRRSTVQQHAILLRSLLAGAFLYVLICVSGAVALLALGRPVSFCVWNRARVKRVLTWRCVSLTRWVAAYLFSHKSILSSWNLNSTKTPWYPK